MIGIDVTIWAGVVAWKRDGKKTGSWQATVQGGSLTTLCQKLPNISHGNVATSLRHDRIFNGTFITKLPPTISVKN